MNDITLFVKYFVTIDKIFLIHYSNYMKTVIKCKLCNKHKFKNTLGGFKKAYQNRFYCKECQDKIDRPTNSPLVQALEQLKQSF